MSIRVRIEHGQGAGTTWRLTQPGVYLLGRAKSCSIQVLDMKVSKEHCEIHLADDGETALLHDLGSTHGYTLNGQPKKGDNRINAGDELRLGLSILRILSDGAADHDLTPIDGRAADKNSGNARAATAATKNALPPDALVGKELSGYRIERKIGAGGMGGVYLAEQISLKRQVALKVLNERFGSDSAFVDQFVNEARAAGALNHPNVVQVYDVGSAEGHYFFSMEVMPGGSMEDRLKEGAVPWRDALNWFLDAANALIFAHKKEILHRDVKPDNLMIAEDGSAKLCDLGLAKQSENSDLMDQGIIGTPHFISPEAIRRKPDIDHRTDLYSLGCSFYRVLTGGNPYPGKTVKEILLGHLNKPVPRVSAKQSDIPRDLDDVVHDLMNKDPDNRIQTPEDLLAALDKVRLRHGLEAHGIRPHSRKPMLIAAAVALLAIIGGIWFATRPPEQVTIKKTVGQLEAEKQGNILAITGEVDGAKNDIKSQFLEWQTTLLKRDLRSSERDEWKDTFWTGYIKEHNDKATEWDELGTSWQGRVAKQKFDEAKDALSEGATFLGSEATRARALAKTHAAYIEGRRKNESAIRTARANARQAFDTAIADHKKKIDDAFAEGRYLEMAVLLRRKQIEDIVTPLRKREMLEVRLLEGKLIDDTVKKTFGDLGKEGPFKDWFGIKRLKEARSKLMLAFNEALKTAKLKPAATSEDIATAKEAIQAFVDRLPTESTPDAGELNSILIKHGKEARSALRELAIIEYERLQAAYAEDKIAAQAFIEKVFAPATAGGSANLRRMGILDAKIEANGLAATARMPEYKVFGAHWKRAVSAVESAVGRAVTSFPKGWSSTKYHYTERGREKSKTFKNISADGFSLNRDAEKYSERSLKWIVENVFFDGDQRRFELQGEELLGLATLAELAARYDVAKSAYEAYAKVAPDDAKAGVAMRLAALENEKEAARVWLRAVDILEELEAFNKAYDPAVLGEDKFAEKSGDLHIESAELAPKILEAETLLNRLRTDPKLASTIWGASVRDGQAHEDAVFAGETAPTKPKGYVKKSDKKDGAKKDDAKKDGAKKDGDGGKKIDEPK